MKQLNRTDFLVLDALSDGERNVAANIAIEVDRNRGYLNSRFQVLWDYGLVERIGPAERSGLYQITPKGKFVLEHEEEYFDSDIDFSSLVEEEFQREGVSA